ncbi:MAG: sigma-70 family RNA polymerase sigma factor [Nitratireductor sp.]
MAGLALEVARDRSQAAFARLFDHFAPRINAYLRKLGLAPSLAEEITQEVMITLWHKAELFDASKSSLSTWLFKIARNRRIDAARRDKGSAIDPDDPVLHPEAEPLPDAGMDMQLREKRVRAAIATLPAEQVEMIRMAFFLGYSHSQIAQETGVALGTVKSRIRLAFTRLRAVLDSDPAIDTD